MKTIKYILLALTTLCIASCMDKDWETPSLEAGMEGYGNKNLQASNLKTIAELKQLYKTEIDNSGAKKVTDAMQIQGVVTGNDNGGNLYNQVVIQDETGAIIVKLSQSVLQYLPVGQKVLIELKDLYVGSYNKQPQIGGLYNGGIGYLDRYTWADHYKITGDADGTLYPVEPIEVTNINQLNLETDCGKLVTLKGFTIEAADGKRTYAPTKGGLGPNDRAITSSSTGSVTAVTRAFKGISNSTLVLYTSPYADFANQIMLAGEVNITGVITRYRDTWQIYMRVIDDIESANPTDPAVE